MTESVCGFAHAAATGSRAWPGSGEKDRHAALRHGRGAHQSSRRLQDSNNVAVASLTRRVAFAMSAGRSEADSITPIVSVCIIFRLRSAISCRSRWKWTNSMRVLGGLNFPFGVRKEGVDETH